MVSVMAMMSMIRALCARVQFCTRGFVGRRVNGSNSEPVTFNGERGD